ncbi:NADH dehydrogenase [ubiquinone] 1 alpha subcomplex subunit 12-like [Amphiura filiformis]|uniref:NADH dehydrogenase [ubiquinone] 1 alpha subcomplex subunit 12-like n=1 Tax=Amphiura filiformis TaxID=82378 RepID=UPI003B2247F9
MRSIFEGQKMASKKITTKFTSHRDLISRFFETIRFNGGMRGTLWKILRGTDLKIGTLVGVDNQGNKYFENDRYFMTRNRWVEYREDKYWNYDASMVPPEWHRWIHGMTDDPPSKVPPTPRKFIWQEHEMNLSGTKQCYVPSTTTPKKIEEWVPPTNTKS